MFPLNASLCKCRGQCYEGALNMGGSKTGVYRVATRVIEEKRRAVFVHSFGHALHLAVGDTLKGLKFVNWLSKMLIK